MENISFCYLCEDKQINKKNLVCMQCQSYLESFVWSHCSRCAKIACDHTCNSMEEFESIICSLQYNNLYSHILSLAKEEQNFNMQKVFENVFSRNIRNTLENLILKHNYSYIMLSPLRQTRLFQGGWHPHLFFTRILDSIKFDLDGCGIKFDVLYPYFSSHREKQAILLPEERERSSSQSIEMFPDVNHKFSINFNLSKILVIDDVMTTGNTAKLCFELGQEYLPGFVWHWYSLFRATQKTEDTEMMQE